MGPVSLGVRVNYAVPFQAVLVYRKIQPLMNSEIQNPFQ